MKSKIFHILVGAVLVISLALASYPAVAGGGNGHGHGNGTPVSNPGSQKNPQQTGPNANNPKNDPGVTQICGNGNHTGNPHCQPPATNPPTEPPTNPPGTQPPGNPPGNDPGVTPVATVTCPCNSGWMKMIPTVNQMYTVIFTDSNGEHTYNIEVYTGDAKSNGLTLTGSQGCAVKVDLENAQDGQIYTILVSGEGNVWVWEVKTSPTTQ